MRTPLIVRDLFTPEQRQELLYACDRAYTFGPHSYDPSFGRVVSDAPVFIPFLHHAAFRAREVFSDPTLLPTYAMWSRYDIPTSRLDKHKDDNACTFTLDYCVRQKSPWDLYVEGEPYTLQEGEALAFFGEDQEHWRGPFEPGNTVEMIFFHFVRPDHWFFNPEAERPERFKNFVSRPIPDL